MSSSTTKLLVLLLLTGTLVSAVGLFDRNKTKRKEPIVSAGGLFDRNKIEMLEYIDKMSIKAQNRKTCNWYKKKENDVIKVVDDIERKYKNEVQPLNETNVPTKMIEEMDSPRYSLDESTAASTQDDVTNDDTQSMTELEPLSSKNFKDKINKLQKKALEEKKSIEQLSNKERERGFKFFAKNKYNTRNQKDTTEKIGSKHWKVNENK